MGLRKFIDKKEIIRGKNKLQANFNPEISRLITFARDGFGFVYILDSNFIIK